MNREPRPLDVRHFLRPDQPWQCGLDADGQPCPLGPDLGGHCPRAAACHPVRRADRWECNRSTLRGGPCDHGPSPDGTCQLVHACSPVRAFRSRRGLVVAGGVLAAAGALLLALAGPWRSELLAPGPLATPHAKLLDAAQASQRCAACHPAGRRLIDAQAAVVEASAPAAASQTELCLNCHRDAIDPQFACTAHNVAPATWSERAAAPHEVGSRRRDPYDPIVCAACHREHQGADHQLAAVADQACHACHRQTFHSFAVDHPEFDQWPAPRGATLRFSHASHEARHFPQAEREFACAACHFAGPAGQQLTRGYADACAACHEAPLAQSLSAGLPLLSLPSLDVDALAEGGSPLTSWPAAATGDFDGRWALASRVLLLGDPRAKAALARLGSDFDAFDVDDSDAQQLAAVAELAEAQRRLVRDLAQGGQQALAQRAAEATGAPLAPAHLQRLAAGLTPVVVQQVQRAWFGDGAQSLEQQATADDQAVRRDQSRGGWLYEPRSVSLRYLPVGHADPWLRGWIDLLVAAAQGPHAELAAELRDQWLAPTAPGFCGSCHAPHTDSQGRTQMAWHFGTPDSGAVALTRFSHAPHLKQPLLGDCRACHAAASVPEASDSPDEAALVARADFAPMERRQCAACHTPTAAGDRCTLCHHYHPSRSELASQFGPNAADVAGVVEEAVHHVAADQPRSIEDLLHAHADRVLISRRVAQRWIAEGLHGGRLENELPIEIAP